MQSIKSLRITSICRSAINTHDRAVWVGVVACPLGVGVDQEFPRSLLREIEELSKEWIKFNVSMLDTVTL